MDSLKREIYMRRVVDWIGGAAVGIVVVMVSIAIYNRFGQDTSVATDCTVKVDNVYTGHYFPHRYVARVRFTTPSGDEVDVIGQPAKEMVAFGLKRGQKVHATIVTVTQHDRDGRARGKYCQLKNWWPPSAGIQ